MNKIILISLFYIFVYLFGNYGYAETETEYKQDGFFTLNPEISSAVKAKNFSEEKLIKESRKREYLSKYINIFRLNDELSVTIKEGNAERLEGNTVFLAGGIREKTVENETKSGYYDDNPPILYDTQKQMWYFGGKSEYERKLPIILKTPENELVIIGGNENAPVETYSVDAVSKPPRKLQIPESKIDVLNGFAFYDKNNNVIFGKIGNDFIEKYNLISGKTEKKEGIEIKGLYTGQDENKVYFATSKSLFFLDKNTLEFDEYAYNYLYGDNELISAYRMPSGLIIMAEKTGIYLFEEKSLHKKYLFKSYYPQKKIQFFKFPFSNNLYFFAGTNNTEIYKIDFKTMSSIHVMTVDLAADEEYVPIVSMPDGSLIIAGSCGKYIYKMIENR